MKIQFIKPSDSFDDYNGISLIAENVKEKLFIKKMSKAKYDFKYSEKTIIDMNKRVSISIVIQNPV